MRVKQRDTRYWLLTGAVGLIIFYPISFDFSAADSKGTLLPQSPADFPAQAAPLQEAPRRSSPRPAGVPSPKEKKILEILSRFETGLEKKQEEKLAAFIHQESRRYGFDPELIVAVISTESSFYNWSISPKGAVGLMQIIPTTGRQIAEMNDIIWHGKDPLFDPFLNIRLGIHYLWMLYLKFGDIHLALTAYNQGPGRVIGWLKAGEEIPTEYAEKVLGYYRQFLNLGGEGKRPPQKARQIQVADRS